MFLNDKRWQVKPLVIALGLAYAHGGALAEQGERSLAAVVVSEQAYSDTTALVSAERLAQSAERGARLA